MDAKIEAAQEAGHSAGSKAKIFISYSRKDMAFADRLEASLRARGFEPLIDRTEIYAFEDWWRRIQALILRADTVVFVLSPDAVASDVALKEVAHAASLNKRFAPIVCRRVGDEAIPEALRRLNFIFYCPNRARYLLHQILCQGCAASTREPGTLCTHSRPGLGRCDSLASSKRPNVHLLELSAEPVAARRRAAYRLSAVKQRASKRLIASGIDRSVRGECASDHAPVWIELRDVASTRRRSSPVVPKIASTVVKREASKSPSKSAVRLPLLVIDGTRLHTAPITRYRKVFG